VGEGVRAIGVTEPTYYRWRAEYGELKLVQMLRLKLLEQGNGRLRRAVADLPLEKLVLKEAASGSMYFSPLSANSSGFRLRWRGQLPMMARAYA